MSTIGGARGSQPGRSPLFSSQPLDSEAGRLARGLVRASDIPAEQVDQVAHDLTAFPINWLKRFDQENVAVVVIKSTQNLADTPLWPLFTPDKCEEMLTKAAPLVKKTVEEFLAGFADIQDPEERAYMLRMAGDDLKQRFDTLSNDEGLGFSVHMTREPKSFEVLAGEHGVDTSDPERLAHWKNAFIELNRGLLETDAEMARPQHGFYLIPYEVYKGKPFRPLSLESMKAITGIDISRCDGANYPENHFILLHDSVVPDPSPHKGHHRVALHESGHMVDWLTKEMPGIGPDHEKKVQQLYEQARQKDAQCPPDQSPFLSDRMKDTPGEFFADAVEAYLTMPAGDAADHHKAENNRIQLQQRNPDLFQYLDWVMKL